MGVCVGEWSCNDRFLATLNQNMPYSVFIWDTQTLSLCSVLNQTGKVVGIKWDPKRNRLAICTANEKLYMWSPEGCSIVSVPTSQFFVRNVQWSNDGLSAILLDKDNFCVCFLRQ